MRRFALTAALAVGSTLGMSAAASAGPADGPFYTCSDRSTGTTYTDVGGALIWLHSWAAARADGTVGATTGATCAGRRATPADGTIAQSLVAGTPQQTYVVIGGAPLLVGSWSAIGLSDQPGSVSYFDAASLPQAGGSEQTNTGAPWNDDLAGYFNPVVRNATFRSVVGTDYRTDYAGHPVILAKAPATQPPIAPQASIDGCLRMNCDPWGDISVAVAGEGLIRVSGYALDGFATRPLTVHFDAAGQPIDIVANQPDASINAGYGIAGDYGFDRVLSVPAGHYDLCTTFVGYAPGGTATPAGCQVVDVPGAKPGKVHRPRVRAAGRGTVVVRWKRPVTHGSTISEYLVKVSGGKKKQVPGAKHKVVLKHLPVGHVVTVKVRAINGIGLGPNSKGSKTVRVR